MIRDISFHPCLLFDVIHVCSLVLLQRPGSFALVDRRHVFVGCIYLRCSVRQGEMVKKRRRVG